MTRLALIPLALAVSCLVASCTVAEIQKGAQSVEQALCAQRAMDQDPRLTLQEAIDDFCTGMQLIPFKEPADAARAAARSIPVK